MTAPPFHSQSYHHANSWADDHVSSRTDDCRSILLAPLKMEQQLKIRFLEIIAIANKGCLPLPTASLEIPPLFKSSAITETLCKKNIPSWFAGLPLALISSSTRMTPIMFGFQQGAKKVASPKSTT